MLWEKITDPEIRMIRARRRLVRDFPFWGILALSLNIKRDDANCPTMATDGVNLYYGAPWVLTLTEDECMGVIAHEAQHCGLRHFARQGARDHKLWNVATDHAINTDLIQAGMTLPKGGLSDPRFARMSAEQIYPVVAKEARDDKTGNTHKPCPWGAVNPQPANDDGTPMTGQEIETLADTWAERAAMALGAARKAGKMAGGHVPTELVAMTATMGAQAIRDWKSELRQFIDVLGSRTRDWKRLSRRGMSRFMALPGERPIVPSVVAFYIDISGSMDSPIVRQALTEAQAALDDHACDAIELVYVNTEIKLIERYEAGDAIAFKDRTSGGTDFSSAMAYAGSVQDYAALVFITDGQTSSWGDEPLCPVLWAITASVHDTARLNPPYGEKLCLYQ